VGTGYVTFNFFNYSLKFQVSLLPSFLILTTSIKMPKLTQTLDAEQAAFDNAVKEIEEWWSSPRQSHIKRLVEGLASVVI
jgi:hypothetical protein